ncbi:MAG: Nif3-like dinuclear metal center hexameric protein [Fretibacterium sp.]|nr:Nif3-like dinuclear metal center hexameric protein [Fretibacterium sp.]
MRVRELLGRVDRIAPFSLAEEWDNIGLMVGDLEAPVRRAAVALDPTVQAVTAAAEAGCEVLLCHHPLLFHPVKKLDLNAGPGCAVREAIRRGVTILAAHTNWDKAGVNAELARLLGLRNTEALDPGSGLGLCGELSESAALEEFLKQIREAWGLTRIDAYAPPALFVSRVALCGGSGGSLWPAAGAQRVDLYITADMKYHELMDANNAGLAVAVADHGEMERASLPELARRLGELTAEDGVKVLLLDTRGLCAPIRI